MLPVTHTEKFVAKCQQSKFTEKELLSLKTTHQYNIENGITKDKSEVKLQAINEALKAKTFKVPEQPSKNHMTKALDTLNDFKDEEDFESVVATRYLQLKDSAKSRGKEFNLTLLDVRRLMQRKTCFFTKRRFDEGDVNWKRTMDRLDASKGYVKGNVVACSKWANSLKNVLVEESDNAVLKGCQKELRKFMNTLKECKL